MLRYWKTDSGQNRKHKQIINKFFKRKESAEAAPEPLEFMEGKRYDYIFQLKMSDPRNWTEYGAAGPAHRSYWAKKDVMLFLLEKMQASNGETSSDV
jgi:hypothetical protein